MYTTCQCWNVPAFHGCTEGTSAMWVSGRMRNLPARPAQALLRALPQWGWGQGSLLNLRNALRRSGFNLQVSTSTILFWVCCPQARAGREKSAKANQLVERGQAAPRLRPASRSRARALFVESRSPLHTSSGARPVRSPNVSGWPPPRFR